MFDCAFSVAEVTVAPNVYQRESAVWSRGLLATGFDRKKVDAQARVLSGPAAISYGAQFPDASNRANSDSLPPTGLSVFGVVFLIVLLIPAGGGVSVLFFVRSGKDQWTAFLTSPSLPLAIIVLATRGVELLLCIVNIAVLANSNFGATAAQVVWMDACYG